MPEGCACDKWTSSGTSVAQCLERRILFIGECAINGRWWTNHDCAKNQIPATPKPRLPNQKSRRRVNTEMAPTAIAIGNM